MLTDIKIKKAKAKDKVYKLTDGNGLFLEISPNGKKRWRYRYRIAGKENLFALGDYCPSPSGETEEQTKRRINARRFTLSEARVERERCRGLVKQEIHPISDKNNAQLRQRLESDNTFTSVAKTWFQDADFGSRSSEGYRRQVTNRMEADVFSYIGRMPIKDVKPPHVLSVMDRVKKRSPTMANLIKTWIGGVFRYAAGRLLVEDDPTYPLRGRIRPKVQHHPHLEAKEIGPFLRALDGVKADLSTIAACKLLWLTVLRTKNIRLACWGDIDFDEAVWCIPAADMKTRQSHIVPLPRQAITLLRSLQAINSASTFVFPGRSSWKVPISHEAFRDIFKRAGYSGKFTPHGVRGTFSTYCNNIGIRSEVIELTLAHQERNAVRRAYNHAKLLPERRALMQQWADALDDFKGGGKVIPIRSAAG
ncbi:MAG: tyrosine-type recombinase/integrase [Pirellulales bacterium]|nr:tyrosine-type recombinase/integrase [Pirellulales bacterium]